MASENSNIIRSILMQGIETLPSEKLTDPGFRLAVAVTHLQMKEHRDNAMDQWRQSHEELQGVNRRLEQDQGNQALIQENLRAYIKYKTYETVVEKLTKDLGTLGGLIDFWNDDDDTNTNNNNNNNNNNGNDDEDDNQGDAVMV